MMNIELARIIQAEREREIDAELKVRRLLRPADVAEPVHRVVKAVRPAQPASSGATSR
jgi:hypothetical protein